MRLEYFAYPFIAHRGLRERVRHFGEVLHRLVHLAEIPDKHNQRTSRKRSADYECSPVPKDESSSQRYDDSDQGRQLGLQAPGAQGKVDAFRTLSFKPLLFVILARKRLNDADGGEHFLQQRDDLAFLSSYVARRLLAPSRIEIGDCK